MIGTKFIRNVMGFLIVVCELLRMMHLYYRYYLFNSDKFKKLLKFILMFYKQGIKKIVKMDFSYGLICFICKNICYFYRVRTKLYGFIILVLFGCKETKWEVVKGKGITQAGGPLNNVIYFEDFNHGIIGGYDLKDFGSPNSPEPIPVLYLTQDGGLNWSKIEFGKCRGEGVEKVYLSNDTIICQIDTAILLSIDQGKVWKLVEEREKRVLYKDKFPGNRYEIEVYDFVYDQENYRVKELYIFEQTKVIVCNKDNTLDDYYFVSKDKGKNWKFLQEDYGSNKNKFLYKDKYLITYEPPFGLQRLKLN